MPHEVGLATPEPVQRWYLPSKVRMHAGGLAVRAFEVQCGNATTELVSTLKGLNYSQ
jgi:hypothetical protein